MKTPRFVKPDGSLVVQPEKFGLLMGNRGVLGLKHFEKYQPCAPSKPWITCVLKKDGVPIEKTEVDYTRLFMLDEVTAFAAGHRPCHSCQRRRYNDLAAVWEKATRYGIEELDRILSTERCDEDGRKKTFSSTIRELPNGVFVRIPGSEQPGLLLWEKIFPWSVDGYQFPIKPSCNTEVQVLTPKSIVLMFNKGFPLPVNRNETIHSSVLNFL